MEAGERLSEAGFAQRAAARYKGRALLAFRQSGELLFSSGLGVDDYRRGRLGAELSLEDGYEACRYAALRQLNALSIYLGGDLSRVQGVLRVFGLIAAVEGYEHLEAAADGFTDVFYEMLGTRGISPRLIMGTSTLPAGGTACEFEVVYILREACCES